VAGLSLGEASLAIPVLGVTLLLDPATLVLPLSLPPVSPSSIPLPIPNTPTLASTSIYAQTFHLEGTGWAASRGLRVTLIP
jgi:hypothetical protein